MKRTPGARKVDTRTLERRVVRAAMSAYRVNFSRVDENTGARVTALEKLWKACAALARVKGKRK